MHTTRYITTCEQSINQTKHCDVDYFSDVVRCYEWPSAARSAHIGVTPVRRWSDWLTNEYGVRWSLEKHLSPKSDKPVYGRDKLCTICGLFIVVFCLEQLLFPTFPTLHTRQLQKDWSPRNQSIIASSWSIIVLPPPLPDIHAFSIFIIA